MEYSFNSQDDAKSTIFTVPHLVCRKNKKIVWEQPECKMLDSVKICILVDILFIIMRTRVMIVNKATGELVYYHIPWNKYMKWNQVNMSTILCQDGSKTHIITWENGRFKFQEVDFVFELYWNCFMINVDLANCEFKESFGDQIIFKFHTNTQVVLGKRIPITVYLLFNIKTTELDNYWFEDQHPSAASLHFNWNGQLATVKEEKMKMELVSF